MKKPAKQYQPPAYILRDTHGEILISKDITPEYFAVWMTSYFSPQYLKYFTSTLIGELQGRYGRSFACGKMCDECKCGLTWTLADRKRAITVMIQHFPEKTNRKIADAVGCSIEIVRQQRRIMKTNTPSQ